MDPFSTKDVFVHLFYFVVADLYLILKNLTEVFLFFFKFSFAFKSWL